MAGLFSKIGGILRVLVMVATAVWNRIYYKVIFTIPKYGRREMERLHHISQMHLSDIRLDDWIHTFMSFESVKLEVASVMLDANKLVSLSGPVIDVELITLNMKSCRLLDFIQTDRPLVVNFGSCT